MNGSAAEVFRVFLKLGLTSFGGPIAHLGYYRKALVERRHWLSEAQYGQLLAICQFLPGPASCQTAYAFGLLRAGWAGGIAAFVAFTLPSALLLAGFASVLPMLSGAIGTAAIHGLKLVACAVVADAVLNMARKLCPDARRRTIAVLAAGATLLAGSAGFQIAVVLAGAVAGLLFCRGAPATGDAPLAVAHGKPAGLALFAVFLGLLMALGWAASPEPTLASVANAFYRSGALVFGGGHVVLPLLQESVVQTGWVSDADFLAGYGAAQAIPGPVFAFSAYLGTIIPSGHGSGLTALVALVCMFLPGLLLVSAALPLWQAISHNPKAARAIAGVNAAVVGLLGAALYDPILTSGVRSGVDLAVALVGFGLLAVWRRSPLWVVLWCVLASVFPALI
ncbi:chromate efflux transporter [Nitrogeniibacter mangrovi]|uniref:Chromate efflux transporter n=1 Tax=Nitrogeniibacter mangrovi TaxID=2016596 RepID=A0A6C1B430_9RHOO|nr:chromate efflux transporter [Nitrogeniibacter mangrovi]QID18421.1 chromate efflux transporter [Nitrogeniibacter mangrovi]